MAELRARHPKLFSAVPVSHEAIRPLSIGGPKGRTLGWLTATLRFGPAPNDGKEGGGKRAQKGLIQREDYRDVLARLYLSLQAKYAINQFDVSITANVILTKESNGHRTYSVFFGQDFSVRVGHWRWQGGGGSNAPENLTGILLSPYFFIRGQTGNFSPSSSSSSEEDKDFDGGQAQPPLRRRPRLLGRRSARRALRRERQSRGRKKGRRQRPSRRRRRWTSLVAEERERRGKRGRISRKRSLSPLRGGGGDEEGDANRPLYEKPFLLKQPGDAYRFPSSLEFSDPLIRRLERIFAESNVKIHSVLNIILLLNSPIPRWQETLHKKGLREINL